MGTSPTETTTSSPPPARTPAQGSAVRLAVLLGILLLSLGALAYDQFVAKPKCEAADTALEEFVQKMNAQPVTLAGGGVVGRADVQKHFGWGPTWTVDNDKDGYAIEYYCWWGYMPILNRQRHFIAVLYKGKSRRYASHYRSEPPKEDLPSSFVPKADAAATGETPGDKQESAEKKDEKEAAKETSEKAPPKGDAAPADAPKESPAGEKSDKDK